MTRRTIRGLRFAILLAIAGAGVTSQHSGLRAEEGPACESTQLEADFVSHDRELDRTIASGNVRIENRGRVLATEHAIHDRQMRTFELPQPFTLTLPDGNTLSGRSGRFDDQLQSGDIEGVAAELPGRGARVDAERGRQEPESGIELEHATYSPCPVSEENPKPLWVIRATRVRHDETAKELVYTNPTLILANLPVAYLPYFRAPDPTVVRTSGFLTPRYKSDTQFGFAIHQRYYFAPAPDREAFFNVLATTEDGAILESSYRRLFRSADFSASTSFTHNKQGGTERLVRGHFFSDLAVRSDNGATFGARTQLASHPGYLRRYDYSTDDRLLNRLYVERFTPESQLEASLLGFQSQRVFESSRTLPFATPDFTYTLSPARTVLGGSLRYGGDIRILQRSEGRNANSAGLFGEWEREEYLGDGIRLNVHGRIRTDYYSFSHEGGEETEGDPDDRSRFLPQAGILLVWPFLRAGESVAQTIEPFAQWIVAPDKRADDEIANEDSLFVEFDEYSLLARNRFTGRDRIETGTRGATGIRYGLLGREGFRLDAVAGQVFRTRELKDFTSTSGLRDPVSDYVFAWGMETRQPIRVNIRHRGRLRKDLSARRNDIGVSASWGRIHGSGTYIFLEADPDASPGAPDSLPRREIRGGFDFRLSNNWTLGVAHTLDVENDRRISTSGSLDYRGPCLVFHLDAKRNYNTSIDAPPVTTISLSLDFLSIGDIRTLFVN